MRLADKVVVITGGGAGLGRECALLFAEHGARLVVSDVDEQRAQNAAKAVTEAGGTAVGVRADVTDEDDVRALMATAVDAYGRLDVTLANAGIPVPGFGTVPFEETTLGVVAPGHRRQPHRRVPVHEALGRADACEWRRRDRRHVVSRRPARVPRLRELLARAKAA